MNPVNFGEGLEGVVESETTRIKHKKSGLRRYTDYIQKRDPTTIPLILKISAFLEANPKVRHLPLPSVS